VGDSLFTRTEVVALRQNSDKPGREPTGLAALRMTTIDQVGRLVLDFHRCAMLPLSPGAADTGHDDDLRAVGSGTAPDPDPAAQWDAAAFRDRVPGPFFGSDLAGSLLRSTADVVTSAPELARLTLNIAATHHDSRAGGSRLLPNLAAVLSWQSCDHTGPVYEGDTLYSDLTVEAVEALPHSRGGLLNLRSQVYAVGAAAVGGSAPDRPVLDWRYRVLHF
jgi:acyl dehydratase